MDGRAERGEGRQLLDTVLTSGGCQGVRVKQRLIERHHSSKHGHASMRVHLCMQTAVQCTVHGMLRMYVQSIKLHWICTRSHLTCTLLVGYLAKLLSAVKSGHKPH